MRSMPLAARDDKAPGASPVQSLDELTPRQRQIIELLREGKVNKEIARELGIGVGTVKQHVVTLFRRLNVSNRTMAVMALAGQAAGDPANDVTQGAQHGTPPGAQREALHGGATHGTQPGSAAPAAAAGASALSGPTLVGAVSALERRPCVLLSFGVPAQADEAALRRLHGLLAAQACDTDAVFLARRGQAGDLIFGLHQVGEGDLMKAVDSARRVHAELQSAAPELAQGLRGGLTVGVVVASMLRQGGWSGEAVASTALGDARELQEQAAPGQLLLGRSVLALMQALGIRGEVWFGAGDEPGAASFSALDALDWRNDRHCYPLVGRREQHAALASLLHGRGQLVLMEAETGMGKSRLCTAALALWRAAGHPAQFCRVHPHPTAHRPGGQTDCSAPLAALQGLPASVPGAPALAVVDDCHLLSPACRETVLAAARAAVQAGAVVLLAGRPMAEYAPLQSGEGVLRLALPRLAGDETAALAAQVLASAHPAPSAAHPAPAGATARQIAGDAAGVPLFAVELARHSGEEGMAISLLATVCARLDGLHLDRMLLRAAARHPAPSVPALAAALGEPEQTVAPLVQRAIATGVLRMKDTAGLEFGHPLLRKIIDYLCLE